MHGRLHTAGVGDVAGLHLPVIICFVETREKVDSILLALLGMVTDGLVEAHPTEILKNISTSERVIS
jgi:PII-like signaling protein